MARISTKAVENKVTKIECSNGLVKLCTPEKHRVVLRQGWVEKELGRVRVGGALGLERRKDHPEHREEQKDGNYPGYERPKITPSVLVPPAAGGPGFRDRYGRGSHVSPPPLRPLASPESNRRAKDATISVRMRTMIPAAAPTPTVKLLNTCS